MSTPYVGDIISIEGLDFSGYPKPTVNYSWLRNGDQISDGPTYEISFDDIGSVIAVNITLTNPYGSSVKLLGYSETEGVLQLPSFIDQPILDSKSYPFKEQVPITIYNLNVSGYPEPDIAIRWYRDGVIIPGENEETFVPTAIDVGSIISTQITLTNIGGSATTTLVAENPIEQADLFGTFASIFPPIFIETFAEIISDIIGYDSIEYRWQVDEGSGFSTFSASPERTYIPIEYENLLIRCIVTAIRSGQGEISFTTLPVRAERPAGQVIASYPPQGDLIAGSGYPGVFVEYGTEQYINNADSFASESRAIFGLGLPEYFLLEDNGFTLDMYAFHGAGIDKVMVSCDGGTEVTAGFEQEVGGTGQGYFYVYVDANNFTAGATYEIRATAYPINGFARSQRMIFTYPDGENKVQIGTDTSITTAYNMLYENYDPYKRNIIEVIESGEYEVGTRVANPRKFESGWIEIIAPSGIEAYIDFSSRGKDWIARPNNSIRPQINAERYVNFTFRNRINDWAEEYADTPVWHRYYIEDDAGTRFWAEGCTFQSDWFSTGNWQRDPSPRAKGGFRFSGGGTTGRKKKVYVTNSYGDEPAGGPLGVELAKNVVLNYCYWDAFTNVKHCINCKSYNKLNPADSALHADHYQLFTNWETSNPPHLMENNILYGYYGQDYEEGVQPFGTFGTGRETYRDWAIVNCQWDCGPNATVAQIGLTYGNILMMGLDLNKSITFRSDAYAQIGPILLQNVNAGNISNGFLHPLEVNPNAINGFRTINVTPDVKYNGIPGAELEAFLTTYYQWYNSPADLASGSGGGMYALDPDGTNEPLYIGITAGGISGPKLTEEIFKMGDTTKIASFNTYPGYLGAITVTGIKDLESALDFESEKWYMSIEIDRGKSTSSFPIKKRTDSKTCDFNFGTGFGGITLTPDQIFNSTTGVTIELKTPGFDESTTNTPRWLIPPTPNVVYPVPGSLLRVDPGVYEGLPEPTLTYTWKKDLAGGTNFSVISGETTAELNLTETPISSGASIRCDVLISNVAGDDIAYVDFGRISDWHTYREGIYRLPIPYDSTPRPLVIIENPTILPIGTSAFSS